MVLHRTSVRPKLAKVLLDDKVINTADRSERKGSLTKGEKFSARYAVKGEEKMLILSPSRGYKYLCRIILILSHGYAWLSAYKM